jgi:hypothetical protein
VKPFETQAGHGVQNSLPITHLRLNQASRGAEFSSAPSEGRKKKAELDEPLAPPFESFATPNVVVETDHVERRRATAAAWAELMPQLVYPLMRWYGQPTPPNIICQCVQHKRSVKVISFTGMFSWFIFLIPN